MTPPLAALASARIDHLVARFERIGEEHMKDLGLYNHALRVEAIGFRPWSDAADGTWLAGILVTPWFMNFMLLPDAAVQLAGAAAGDKRRLDLPCGTVTFTTGEVDGIGSYLASSLYSPMGQFPEHGSAGTTARSAMEKFFMAAPKA